MNELVDILVVDDDPVDLQIASRLLKRVDPTVAVLTLCGGRNALEYLRGEGQHKDAASRTLPKVVLLDLKMAAEDGVAVLTEIRAHPRTRSLPVVMFSASANMTDIAKCYRAGANAYLLKPCDSSDFRETMAQVCAFWLRANRVANAEPARC